MKPKRLALAAMLLSSCAFTAAKAETFTLAEALSLAYQSNPQLEAQRAALRASDEEVARAEAGWRPSASASGSIGYEQGQYYVIPGPRTGSVPREATVTISQPLFRGDVIANIRKAKALVESGRGQLVATEESVLLNAATAYFDVVRYQDTVKLEQDNVQALQILRDTVSTRVMLGDLSRTDQAQTEGRLQSAMEQVQLAQSQLAGARATFERYVGRPAESLEAQTVFPVVPENLDTAINLAVQNNPSLLYVREQAVAADYAVDAAFGQLFPTLSLQGQYQRSADFVAKGIKINALSITAQLTVPLYQGGAEYAGIREAKEQRNQATYDTADAERQIREQVRTADEAMRDSQAAVRIDENQVAATQLAYEGVQQETIAGTRTTLDVLIAEQDLVSARVSLANARRNAYVSAYQLLSGTGGLTAKALNLPVKLYDPQVHYDQDATRWFGFGN
ncbi:MAG TPA: TolC family outer membrane protein [Micropepsaceae bacterium]|nr:TolC family outer membrane protein [Micropepsaceae bacterium]